MNILSVQMFRFRGVRRPRPPRDSPRDPRVCRAGVAGRGVPARRTPEAAAPDRRLPLPSHDHTTNVSGARSTTTTHEQLPAYCTPTHSHKWLHVPMFRSAVSSVMQSACVRPFAISDESLGWHSRKISSMRHAAPEAMRCGNTANLIHHAQYQGTAIGMGSRVCANSAPSMSIFTRTKSSGAVCSCSQRARSIATT